MVFTYQPPRTEIAQDTLPELLPIFTFMNSHSNKMYQEGYFLKLNDLDTRMFLVTVDLGMRADHTCRGPSLCRSEMG